VLGAATAGLLPDAVPGFDEPAAGIFGRVPLEESSFLELLKYLPTEENPWNGITAQEQAAPSESFLAEFDVVFMLLDMVPALMNSHSEG